MNPADEGPRPPEAATPAATGCAILVVAWVAVTLAVTLSVAFFIYVVRAAS